MEKHDPNVCSTILGSVSWGFWSPFLDLGARSAIFWHLKTPNVPVFKKWHFECPISSFSWNVVEKYHNNWNYFKYFKQKLIFTSFTILYYFICLFLYHAFWCVSSDDQIVCSIYKQRTFRQCVKTCVSEDFQLFCKSICTAGKWEAFPPSALACVSSGWWLGCKSSCTACN